VIEKRYWARTCEIKCTWYLILFERLEINYFRCRYLPTYGMTENTRRDSQQFLRDCGVKAELSMLAVQLGTEETNYERPFTLNLLSNMDIENVSNANNETDGKSVNQKNAESGKAKLNEDYKAKLDNVYADFFEDENEGLKRSMDLLDLLDELE